MNIVSGQSSPEVLGYLLKRRSVKAADLEGPGPSAEQLETILKAATRVPDHGKLCPWYFIVLEGEARAKAGQILARAYQNANPQETEEKIKVESERFLRAPIVVGVVSRFRHGKPPLWEQILSCGAVCMNMILAANALGFAANWITEWYSYNDEVKKAFGLDARDHFAGFVYIGTPAKMPEERERPDLSLITTNWTPGCTLNKGEIYNNDKFDIPAAGFKVP